MLTQTQTQQSFWLTMEAEEEAGSPRLAGAQAYLVDSLLPQRLQNECLKIFSSNFGEAEKCHQQNDGRRPPTAVTLGSLPRREITNFCLQTFNHISQLPKMAHHLQQMCSAFVCCHYSSLPNFCTKNSFALVSFYWESIVAPTTI